MQIIYGNILGCPWKLITTVVSKLVCFIYLPDLQEL